MEIYIVGIQYLSSDCAHRLFQAIVRSLSGISIEDIIQMRSISCIRPIILAAGHSSRMGYPKALLPLGDDTFLTRILKTIGKIPFSDPVIILGKAADQIKPMIGSSSVRIVINEDPDRGQLSSIQIGLSNVDSGQEAGMIWPVDLPGVSEDLVHRIALEFINSKALIVYPKCGSRRGHPAIFHRTLFQEFMDAPLNEGAKNILIRHQPDTLELPTDELATIRDIDTPSEYEMMTGETLGCALARVKAVGSR
jgi:molybdenum cofactor cytidylyltransferase